MCFLAYNITTTNNLKILQLVSHSNKVSLIINNTDKADREQQANTHCTLFINYMENGKRGQ